MNHDYTLLIPAIEAALGQQRVLRRHAYQKRRAFALDLGLVALGCRTACLNDVVFVADPERVFVDLLRILRESHSCFNSVHCLYDAASQQTFFVNTAKFDASTAAADVAFILLSQDPQILARPPADVSSALRSLATTNPPALPPDLAPHTAIPLAAVLLGYPVAYVPAETSQSGVFLAQTTLDVYTCCVRAPTWEHALLKFSCPAALGLDRFDPPRVVSGLVKCYEPRINELGLAFFVVHSAEVMDRVAL